MSKSHLFLATLGLICASAPLSAQSLHPVDDDYTVTVQNNRDEEVTVYLDTTPFEVPLGKIGAMSIGTFALPEWRMRGKEVVELQIHPRGGAMREARVRLDPDGSHIALTLPNKESDDVLVVVSSELNTGPSVTIHNHEGEWADVYFTSNIHVQRLGRIEGESVMTFGLPGWDGMNGQIVLAREGAAPVSTSIWLDDDAHVSLTLD
jgi:hypothetical protein